MPTTYPDEQKATFKKSFAVKKRRQFMFWISLILVALLGRPCLSPGHFGQLFGVPGSVVAFLILIALVIPGAVYYFVDWRCPACGCFLRQLIGVRFYPSCGVELS